MMYSRYLMYSVPFIVVLASALTFGFLSPDSINYLTMAITDGGELCHVGGEVFGLFPCGYPLAVNITSLLTTLDVFAASKVFNILALLACFFIFRKIFSSDKVALLLTFNPFSIHVALHTWSEIIILFSFVLYCLMLHFIRENKKVTLLTFLGVFAAIFIGCFSRYAFAPYCVFLFLVSFILIRHQIWKLLPAFAIVAVMSVVNRLYLSDFDMERIPAMESQLLILFQFVKSSIKYLIFSSPLILLWLIYVRNSQLKNAWVGFFVASGVAYLAVILLLRSLYQFDFFGVRLVGMGYALIIIGLLLSVKDKLEKLPAYMLVIVSLLTYLLVTEGTIVRQPVPSGQVRTTLSETLNLKKVDNGPKSYAIVVTDKTWLHPKITIKGLFPQFKDEEIVFLPAMPYKRKYDISVMEERLVDKPCKIYFDLKGNIEAYVSQEYRVGMNKKEQRFSESVQQYMLRKYQDPDNRCF